MELIFFAIVCLFILATFGVVALAAIFYVLMTGGSIGLPCSSACDIPNCPDCQSDKSAA